VVAEPESPALESYLATRRPRLLTSRIAEVEVVRATRLADPAAETIEQADRILAACHIVEVTSAITHAARELAGEHVRTLDAIHLASALQVGPTEVVVYDRRLADAVSTAGLAVVQPGAAPHR
jgi:uncharacterized protein